MRVLIIGGLGDNHYGKVINQIHKGNEIILVDNLQSGCLKNLRLIMNEVGFPPKFYEVDYFDKREMDQIYGKYKFDVEINFIKNK